MAITKIEEPYDFTPAYNEVIFTYDSTNKNIDGFRYIFDVYASGTATKIAEYRVLPRITDGYGTVDLSRLLRGKVTYNFNESNTTSYDPTNCYYKYDVKIGEEYIQTLNYTASLTNDGGYVNITVTHSFQVGDQIDLYAGATNLGINGLWVVTAINGTTDFTISALWANVVDATANGTVQYADKRKTVTRDITTETNKYVFNGALPWREFRTYNEATYLLSTGTDKLLTSMPLTGFYATTSQDLWINFGNNSVTTGFVYFENSNGDVFKKAITNNKVMTGVAVGPDNAGTLTLVSGTAGLVKASTTYYDFWYATSLGVKISEAYRVNIDTRCKIEDYEIAFLDRMGSIGSFAFQLRAYEKGNINRQTYNKDVTGSTSSSMWTYANTEAGLTTFQVNVEKTIELNTNWMTEEMAAYFEELLSSPATWIKDGSAYYACIVQDSTFEVEKQRNRNLIRKTITVKLANQNIVNA